MKYLVIVESPSKVAKIQKILSESNDGHQYQLAATAGHILSLNAEKTLGVDVANRYRPDYVPHPEKKDIIANLRAIAKRVDKVIIASDLDQEGEFIGYSICHLLGIPETTTPRIIFIEITKDAILKAIKTHGQLDFNVLDAQKCRRIADRLIGFLITRAAKSINPKLTVGRVQTIMVKLIIDREKEIENFQKSLSYHTQGYFTPLSSDLPTVKPKSISSNEIEARLNKVYDNHDDIEKFMKVCATPDTKFRVKSLTDKINSKSPPPPLITSSLQSLVSRSLGISPKEVMDTAQRLYQEGLISYPRTDCPKLPEEKMDECASYIKTKYGDKYHERRTFKSTDQSAQEAHSCIYPTKIEIESLEQLSKNSEFEYNSRMQRVYRYIWLYAVSSQMSPSETKVTKCVIEVVPPQLTPSSSTSKSTSSSSLTKNEFIAENNQLIFEGFQKVWGKTVSRSEDDEEDPENPETPENPDTDDESGTSTSTTAQSSKNQAILTMKEGDYVNPIEIQSRQKAAQGPTPYTEANLITQMKRYGVGRPSTHGTILSQIIDDTKGFLYKGNKAGEKLQIEILTWKPRADKTKIMVDKTTVVQSAHKNRLYSTELGRAIDNFVNEYFSDIFNYNFTRNLEGDMKKIENGELNWYEVVDRVYKAFAPKLKQFPTWTTKENAESNPARKPKREIGTYNDKNVYAYLGKFGPVLQIGEDTDQDRQHIGLPKECNIETITYPEVEYLFGFPYNLGTLTDGRQVLLKKSKHGLYLDCTSPSTSTSTSTSPSKASSTPSKSKSKVVSTTASKTETEVKKTYQVTEDMFETFDPNTPMESQIKAIKFELVKNHIQVADTPKEYLRQIDDIKIIKGKYGPYFIFNGKLVGVPKYHNVDIITYDECLQLYASKNGTRSSKKSPTPSSSISQDTTTSTTKPVVNIVKKPIIKMKNVSSLATTSPTKSSPIPSTPSNDETKKKLLFKKKI